MGNREQLFRDDSGWMIDVATLSALYGRGSDCTMSPYEGIALYADAGRSWDSGPAQFGKDWEVDLGYDGPSGKGRTPGRKGRTL